MIKDLKIFAKDYADLCKQSKSFYKDHWKGVIALNVGLGVVGLGAMFIPKKVNDYLEKKNQDKNE